MKSRKFLCLMGLCFAFLWAGCGPDITADEEPSDLSQEEEMTQDQLSEKNDVPAPEKQETIADNSAEKSTDYKDSSSDNSSSENIPAAPSADSEDASSDSQDTSSKPLPEDSGFYQNSTSFPSSQVEDFAQSVKAMILDKDWNGLSEQIAYPIQIDGKECQNSSDFLALDFENSLNPDFLSAIETESCQEMFHNWQGISMGANSALWFAEVYSDESNSSLLITSFHGLLKES